MLSISTSLYVICDITNTFLVYLVLCKLLPQLKKRLFLLLFLLISIGTSFIDLKIDVLGTFISIGCFLLIPILIDPHNFKIETIASTAALLLTMYTQQISFYLIIRLFNTLYLSNSNYSVIFLAVILNYVLTFLLFKLGQVIFKHLNISNDPVVINITFSLMIILFSFYLLNTLITKFTNIQFTYSTFLMIFLSLVVFIVIALIYLLIHSHEQTVKAEYELELVSKRQLYTKRLEQNYQELRDFKHDYKNLLLSVSTTLDNSDSLKHLLEASNVETSDSSIGHLYHLSNNVIRNTVITKFIEAESKGILTTTEVADDFQFSQNLTATLEKILSLLLSESISTCQTIADSTINLAMISENDCSEIVLSSTSPDIQLQQLFKTNKSLIQVKNIVSKNSELLLQTKYQSHKFSAVLTIIN